MHHRSLIMTRKDVSLHDPIGTDKEGNEITLINILGSEADDVIKAGSADAAGDCEGSGDLAELCVTDREAGAHEAVS